MDIGNNYSLEPESIEPKPREFKVTNLLFKTTEDSMREYFENFGELDMCKVADTEGRSSGYGFIKFKDIASQRNCLRQDQHSIDGRSVYMRRRGYQYDDHEIFNQCENKIFLAKLNAELSEELLTEYFNHFGDVKNVKIPTQFRVFGFVTYTNVQGVYEAVEAGEYHVIDNHKVKVCIAKGRDSMNGDIRYNESHLDSRHMPPPPARRERDREPISRKGYKPTSRERYADHVDDYRNASSQYDNRERVRNKMVSQYSSRNPPERRQTTDYRYSPPSNLDRGYDNRQRRGAPRSRGFPQMRR